MSRQRSPRETRGLLGFSSIPPRETASPACCTETIWKEQKCYRKLSTKVDIFARYSWHADTRNRGTALGRRFSPSHNRLGPSLIVRRRSILTHALPQGARKTPRSHALSLRSMAKPSGSARATNNRAVQDRSSLSCDNGPFDIPNE